MSRQPIRHFTDLEGSINRRTILKGMFRSAAAGILLPYATLEQQSSQSESLQEAVNRIGKMETGDERF